ncbi:MAG: SpoIIE family protein phosphatase, partial [bacterium]|nr:SpoIIE family protein phosphatase [bacterium]
LILTPVESALQGDYKKDVDENFLKNIQRNGIRLLKLINNLLDFAKIEAGRMDLKMKEVDIVRLMKSYWNYIHSTVESNELRFSFYSERKSMNVFLDIDKTDKIAMNLFSNSLKFTEKGGEMAMRITEDERSCFIEFSDTGVGIPPDKIDIIFDRFGQAATGPSRGYEGSGIGLALVKELVEMQGGTIKVESRYINDHPKDHGTVFTIQYPKGSERLANQDEIEFVPGSELEETAADPWFAGIRELRDLGGEENYKPVSVEMRSLKETNGAALLIVEDNSGMRNFLVSLFKNSYSLTTAVNGREGFEKARELKPDLVITDVMMPELDGNEMTRMLKEDKELKSIPVIMLTAKARVAQKIEGLEYGADDYVTKPFNSRELMARVRSLLEKRENQRALAERNRVIEDELAVARLLQQKLMPAHLPEISGYRAAVQYIPMDAVGGDFYDFKTNEDSIELFIADVSGHGLPGAFLSMITKMAFENIRERSSTKNVLYQINDVICRYTVQNNFVTAFYCIINRDTNVMKFSSAGHFPQFIYRESNNTFYDLNTKGRPLGWFSDLQLEEKEISLKADDRVILYTDGITESENPGNKLFGIGSFKDFVQESRAHSPEEFTHAIIAHLKEYSEKEEFDDDLCLIVFDVL